MLCITRKREESIRIGDTITIKILELGGGRVRLGISAPREVGVLRTELDGEAVESFDDDPPPYAPQGRDDRAGRKSSAPLPVTGGRIRAA